jgi:hypothetical protein
LYVVDSWPLSSLAPEPDSRLGRLSPVAATIARRRVRAVFGQQRACSAAPSCPTVRIEKANDQEEGPVTAFRLEQVKIGVGEDLEDIMTSILSAEIPTVTTERNNGGEDRLSDREALALRALSHCLAEHGINPELPGLSDAKGHVCPVKTWRDELISRGLLEKQANGGHRMQCQRLRLALERKGQIGQKDGYVWLLIQHNPG